MNIFEVLRNDHDVQRDLIKNLVATEGASPEREELFNELKSELTSHAGAEERCFYIPLMDDDLTQDKARHSVAEHHELDELVEKLGQTKLSSPGWLVHAKTLCERLRHHLDEEEHEVFQLAGKVLSEKQKRDLAVEYLIEKERQHEHEVA